MTTRGFEASIKHMSFTAKAGQATLRAFAAAGNMLAGLAIAKAIQFLVTAVDNWIHRVDKANEAMEYAISSYEDAKSSLENINSKLETHQEALDKLLAKDKLTYAEKGQLEELQAITRELLLQQNIEQKKNEAASKEAADQTVNAFQKQYHYDLSEEHLKSLSSPDSIPMVLGEDDVAGNLSAYLKSKELWEQTLQQYEQEKQLGNDSLYLKEDAQYYYENMKDYEQALNNSLSDLWDKLSALKDEYNKAVIEQQNTPSLLTPSDLETIDTYESIYAAIKMIYEYTNKSDWNSIEIESIFHKDQGRTD